jgi:Flp pilus assembly protein TadD
MSLERGRVCASCGARNKPRWEFCVRCGEALVDAEPEPVQDEVGRAPRDVPWRAWLLSALALGGAIAAYVVLQRGPGAPPSPDLFTIGAPAPTPGAVPRPPTSSEAVEGERMLASGNFLAAIPLLAEAVNKQPEDTRLLKLYAQALRRANQHEASVEQLRRVTFLSEDPVARLDLARTLDLLGRDAEAKEAYEALLRIAPRSAEGLGLLAGLHTRAGRHAEALPLLRRLSELRPDDLGTRQNLAFALEKTGDEGAAIEQYSSIVEAVPTANIARGRLAEAIARQGDNVRAEALFREGIALDPSIPALHRSLGNLLERKGSYEQAAVAYREYARLAPNSPDAKPLADRAEQLEKRRASAS